MPSVQSTRWQNDWKCLQIFLWNLNQNASPMKTFYDSQHSLKKGGNSPFSSIPSSSFPRPVRWSSASVCRIYEWTGWFPYLIYFPYEETLVGCWVLHPYGCCEKHPPTLLLPLVPLFVLVFQHQSPGIWSKVLSMISHHFWPLS